MLRFGLLACAACALAFAEGFSFDIGSPMAAGDFHFKSAAFVFRAHGCAEPAKAQITASAEGLVKRARQSLPLKVMATSKAGVFAVGHSWPAEGEWVVNLKGTCARASAGAIVPFGPKGFIRESAKFYSRPATDAEIETSLKALAQGVSK